MKIIKVGFDTRVIGIVAEGGWGEVDFVEYFIENGVYQSRKLVEAVELSDVYLPSKKVRTLNEQMKIRRENIRKEAKKRFPNIKKVYFTEPF